MAEARDSAHWNHTSCLLAMIHNANAKNQKSAKKFHPYEQQKRSEGMPITADNIEMLKLLLPPEKRKAKKKQDG